MAQAAYHAHCCCWETCTEEYTHILYLMVTSKKNIPCTDVCRIFRTMVYISYIF